MPRDKKVIHRATSDVEDETISDEEEEPVVKTVETSAMNEQRKQDPKTKEDLNNLMEERRKFLKEAILKRTQALKQQRERDKYHTVNSTFQKY